MKILLINDNHEATGGAERYFLDLKQRLQSETSHQVYSLGFGKHAYQDINTSVLPATQAKWAKLTWRLLPQPFLYRKLRRLIKNIAPDVVHLHNVKQFTATLLLALRDQCLVHTAHDFSLLCPLAQNIHNDGNVCTHGWQKACSHLHHLKHPALVYKLLVWNYLSTRAQLQKYVKHYLAPSPILADYLAQNHFQPINVAPPFMQLPKAYDFTQLQAHHFLFAGNLAKHKGLHILLQAFKLALRENNQLILHLAGTGNEKQNFFNELQQANLAPHIRWHAWVNDLSPLYQQCCAVIFPSTGMESFGLVITEAMSHARAVIGAKRSTVPCLVEHQVTGLLYEPEDSHALAQHILTLAAQPKLAQQLGQAGFDKLQQRVDNQAALASVLKAYESAVEIAKSGG
jgi:glycosyltransferase involved in cell wall biosynthesis